MAERSLVNYSYRWIIDATGFMSHVGFVFVLFELAEDQKSGCRLNLAECDFLGQQPNKHVALEQRRALTDINCNLIVGPAVY